VKDGKKISPRGRPCALNREKWDGVRGEVSSWDVREVSGSWHAYFQFPRAAEILVRVLRTNDGMTGRRRNVMDLHLRVWRPRDYGRENQAIGLSMWRILMKLEAKLSAFSFDLMFQFRPGLPSPHRGGPQMEHVGVCGEYVQSTRQIQAIKCSQLKARSPERDSPYLITNMAIFLLLYLEIRECFVLMH
jgi:hypothetical protein